MNKLWAVILLVSIFGCSKEKTLFKEVSPTASGVDFTNALDESNELNILDYLYFYNGGGVALGDINNDGLPDIFLTSNQGSNKLYLNQGDFKFKDITESAGVSGNSSWNTGTVMIDVNADGDLDILVGAVVGINGFTGHNELYINNGDATFTEQAAQWGLDLQAFTSGFTFLDYDLDGDLDIYVLNHAVHTQESFGRSTLREKRNAQTGDRLMRNDGNIFTDVSEEAGIYGGVNSYGLGVSVADFNMDGYPDLYVGNDFHEDDYFYLNNGDGTFTESLTSYFGHTSRFSMGNDVADINNDGWPDLISLDMLPWDESVVKASEGDDNYQTLSMRTKQYGYHYQFSRNMLYVNQGGTGFSEVALQSGVAATDWSWSALFADFNLDGYQDLHIANGIPRRPNDLDFVRFISNQEIQKTISENKLLDQEALDKMPSGSVPNKMYSGQEGFTFTDTSGKWISQEGVISTASAVADLDLDGDLDIVTNNINAPASILENQSEQNNYLAISLDYTSSNSFGIGAKVTIHSQEDGEQWAAMNPVKGFQSSSEPLIVFGLDTISKIDSLTVVWPDNTYQVLREIEVNKRLTITPLKKRDSMSIKAKAAKLFELIPNNLGIDYIHKEDNYLDFNRQKLIPYRVSDMGPAFAHGDLNGDGLSDLFFGGSKFSAAATYLQSESGYQKVEMPTITADSIREDITATIADLNGDGQNDLFVTSGGADFTGKKEPLLDRYYAIRTDSVARINIEDSYDNSSVVVAHDYDGDGDQDLFVGGQVITSDFGARPESYLLVNQNGTLVRETPEAFEQLGMVTDALWDDFDGDGQKDLIVIGSWMQPTFFKVTNGAFTKVNNIAAGLNGLWQQIHPFDMQGDGDTDYLLGNWGLNSKFKASNDASLYMYYADFDDNGSTETVLAQKVGDHYYPLLSFDELAGQMVNLRKKYNSYTSFAGQTMNQIFGQEVLDRAQRMEVSELRSGYLQNNNGEFTFVAFPDDLQIAPLKAFVTFKFDDSNTPLVLVAGNYFGVIPFHGRYDSFGGALVHPDGTITSTIPFGLDFKQKSVRHLEIINLQNKPYLLAVFNDDKIATYSLLKNYETN